MILLYTLSENGGTSWRTCAGASPAAPACPCGRACCTTPPSCGIDAAPLAPHVLPPRRGGLRALQLALALAPAAPLLSFASTHSAATVGAAAAVAAGGGGGGEDDGGGGGGGGDGGGGDGSGGGPALAGTTATAAAVATAAGVKVAAVAAAAAAAALETARTATAVGSGAAWATTAAAASAVGSRPAWAMPTAAAAAATVVWIAAEGYRRRCGLELHVEDDCAPWRAEFACQKSSPCLRPVNDDAPCGHHGQEPGGSRAWRACDHDGDGRGAPRAAARGGVRRTTHVCCDSNRHGAYITGGQHESPTPLDAALLPRRRTTHAPMPSPYSPRRRSASCRLHLEHHATSAVAATRIGCDSRRERPTWR